MHHHLLQPGTAALVLACALAAATPAAHAARASLYSFNGGGTLADQTAPGSASVSFSNSAMSGSAHADEFTGGVGAFASAIGRHAGMAAQASAASVSRFTVDCKPAPDEQTCDLFVPIIISGSLSAHGAQNSNPLVFGSAQASYSADWTLRIARDGLTVRGGGQVTFSFYDDGRTEEVTIGAPHTTLNVFTFEPGDEVTLSLSASVGAYTSPSGFFPPDMGTASAAADFSHTLRWGGVSEARSAKGELLDLGQVRLLGTDGFDYVNAAPANPFASPVPEPATALLGLLGGAVLLAGRARRRAGHRQE